MVTVGYDVMWLSGRVWGTMYSGEAWQLTIVQQHCTSDWYLYCMHT